MIFNLVRNCLRNLSIERMSFLNVVLALGGGTLLVILICSPLLYWAELPHEDANIKNFPDALWLCFMIVTTIGFGDFYPVSLLGRLIAVPLAATGIGVFGTLAGYFGSMLLDRVVRQATTDMLHEQNKRIEMLVNQNKELNTHIRDISAENQELNHMIMKLAQDNTALNRKIDHDTDEILKALKNNNQA